MTSAKLTKTQSAALNYITLNGYMLLNQQGLRAMPNGAKALLAQGLVKVETVDFYGTPMEAYVLV